MSQNDEMTDEEFEAWKEDYLEEHHTHYGRFFACKRCGQMHGIMWSFQISACYKCGSRDLEASPVQRFRDAIDISRGGPAVGIYETFKL